MNEAKIEPLVVDESDWSNRIRNTEQERYVVALFRGWVEKERPPYRLKISPSNGYCYSIYAIDDEGYDVKLEPEYFRPIIGWLSRMSGKKFFRTVRGGTTSLLWWNTDYIVSQKEGGSAISVKGNEHFERTDGRGEIKALFIVENAPLGACKIVERKVTQKFVECSSGE